MSIYLVDYRCYELFYVSYFSQVKVWNTGNGFCFVTFKEHTGGITGVTFTQNGKVIVSSSLDGTVRAFDLHRYVL